MPKLKKEDFNQRYRFRESRLESLVNCANCGIMSEVTKGEGEALCNHSERFRKVKIAEYIPQPYGGSHNVAPKRVCDAYTPKPLPEGVIVPTLPEKQAILLGTQFRDPYHGDTNCPYVIEEARMIATKKPEGPLKADRAEIYFFDISELVPRETVREICEMPCCESKLPFQMSRIDNYRRSVGIKPDGSEPIIWVRNGIINHKKKFAMTPAEVEAFFDLSRFASSQQGIHRQISDAMDYLRDGCNKLGSKPLAEATNPVCLPPYYYNILGDPLINPDKNLEFWVYNEKLFDWRKNKLFDWGKNKLGVPIRSLEIIPEGIIPCIDTKDVLRGLLPNSRLTSSAFQIYGSVRTVEPILKLPNGVSHFVEIGAVVYHDSNSYMGAYGKGFHGCASFDAE